jgi:CRP-like cAMP-binding protein
VVTQGGTVVNECGPGHSVGEIALLRGVPRTASVRAVEDVQGVVLERADFVEAVTGNPASERTAERLVTDRLAKPVAPG